MGRCDAGGSEPCERGTGTYCVMSCEWWSSPLYCDKDHPQDIFSDSDGRSTWNHLVNAVLADGAEGGARSKYFTQVSTGRSTYPTFNSI